MADLTTTTAPVRWQLPRLDRDDRVVAGLASGVARELGVEARAVRLALLLLAAAGGWGLWCYAAGWGAVAALEFTGRGPGEEPVPKGRSADDRLLGLCLVTAGLALLFVQLPGLPLGATIPLGLAGGGLAVAWRQLRPDTRGRTPGSRGLGLAVAGILTAGIGTMVASSVLLDRANSLGVNLALGLVLTVVVASSPWWWRLVQAVDAEREARIRSDERAEVAAHLHDSVLQTLTLMQKTDDAAELTRLARTQERELRNWLDPDRVSRRGGSLRGRLDELVDEIERQYDLRVDVVTVGDCLMDDGLESAVAATREAVVNAAKHAQVDDVSVFAEVGDDEVELFVRDRGVGFDPDAVTPDRQGIRNSIRDRLERAGGQASVLSEPGHGTEIELRVPRSTRKDD